MGWKDLKAWVKGTIIGVLLFVILNILAGWATRGLISGRGDYFFLVKPLIYCPAGSICNGVERVNIIFIIFKIIIILSLLVPIIIGQIKDKNKSRTEGN